MKYFTHLFLFGFLILACTGCAQPAASAQVTHPSETAPDADALSLLDLSAQALLIAQKTAADVSLRQVDTNLFTTDFRYTDGRLTEEIMVAIPGKDAPISQWYTVTNTVSPLLTGAEPGLDLHDLKVGPLRVALAVTARWPGCALRTMTLYLENGALTWVAFCNTPGGVVSALMDARTGQFRPSDGQPGSSPVTATPGP